jgi:hypothetical protein
MLSVIIGNFVSSPDESHVACTKQRPCRPHTRIGRQLRMLNSAPHRLIAKFGEGAIESPRHATYLFLKVGVAITRVL